MNSQKDSSQGSVEDRLAAIVAQGEDLRKKVADAVMDGAHQVPTSQKGFIDLSRSVLNGAISALDKAVPHNRDNALREVIDGLGDGLSKAALATQLAMEEAKAEGRHFAEEDLSRATRDLRTLGELFVDTVSQATNQFKSMTGAELGALRRHTEQTMKRILPSINSALATIQERPLQFGKESIDAGVELSRQMLGSLFAAIGRQMESASKRLIGESSVE